MYLSKSLTMVSLSYDVTCYLQVITIESVLCKYFRVIDIVDLTPILRENILHANFCFLQTQITDVTVTGLEFLKEFDYSNVYLVSDW